MDDFGGVDSLRILVSKSPLGGSLRELVPSAKKKSANHRTNILIIRFSSYTYDAQIGQFEPLRLTSRRRIAIHILDPNCAHV